MDPIHFRHRLEQVPIPRAAEHFDRRPGVALPQARQHPRAENRVAHMVHLHDEDYPGIVLRKVLASA